MVQGWAQLFFAAGKGMFEAFFFAALKKLETILNNLETILKKLENFLNKLESDMKILLQIKIIRSGEG